MKKIKAMEALKSLGFQDQPIWQGPREVEGAKTIDERVAELSQVVNELEYWPRHMNGLTNPGSPDYVPRHMDRAVVA